jgi:hypothetical protein
MISLTSRKASELQSLYAPELNITGAALGGLVPNPRALQNMVNQGSLPSYSVSSMLGLSKDYQNLSDWLSANLVPALESKFRKAQHQCLSSDEKYDGQNIAMYYKQGVNALNDLIPQSVYKWGSTMGLRATPKIPWYVYEVRVGVPFG